MKPRSILYIEDDDAASELVRIILNEEAPELKFLRARDHIETAKILLECQELLPDMILLDLNLPQKNGFEILSDLKSNRAFNQIPVVMFSTSSASSDRSKALAGGAQDYIIKPATFDRFVAAVRAACLAPRTVQAAAHTAERNSE